ASGGGHDAGERLTFAEFVCPDNLSGFVVEGTNGAAAPEILVAAAPAFDSAVDGAVVDAEEAMAVDVEQIRLRAEAGRHPVGGAVGAGRGERAIGAGIRSGIGDGAAALVDALRPGGLDERRGEQMFAGGAIEYEEKSVATGLGNELARLAVEVVVEQHRCL